MKRWIKACLGLLAAGVLMTGCASQGGEAQTGAEKTQAQTETEAGIKEREETAAEDLETGRHHVVIHVKDYGPISVELYGDEAPITVTNFLKLAREGFYDGLTFHRIISGFMIQGGDPLGNGMGGSGQEIKGEFSGNGVDNPLEHTRGAISMARSMDPDSASSQFFIVHEDSPHLNGQYAAFGYVTEGMEVVDQICEDTPVEDGNGTVARENQPVIERVEVID